jgi:putative membrane protein
MRTWRISTIALLVTTVLILVLTVVMAVAVFSDRGAIARAVEASTEEVGANTEKGDDRPDWRYGYDRPIPRRGFHGRSFMGGHHGVWLGADRPWYFFGFMVLRALLLVVLGILVFRLVQAFRVRAIQRHGHWMRHSGPDALAVLAERYARGEIDEAEYRSRKAVLEG